MPQTVVLSNTRASRVLTDRTRTLAVAFMLIFSIVNLQKLKFVEGSFAYQLWQKPPVKVYVNVYIFNVTNADRFLAGEDDKLNVVEIGPYVYW